MPLRRSPRESSREYASGSDLKISLEGNVEQDGGQASGEEENLWTAIEAAAYLKVSPRWMLQGAGAGIVPHRRIPGRVRCCVRFVPAEIRAFALGEIRKSA